MSSETQNKKFLMGVISTGEQNYLVYDQDAIIEEMIDRIEAALIDADPEISLEDKELQNGIYEEARNHFDYQVKEEAPPHVLFLSKNDLMFFKLTEIEES